MASSMVLRCGGGGLMRIGDWRSNRLNDRNVRMTRNQRNHKNQISCSSTAEMAVDRVETRKKNRRDETALRENVIDKWMKDSVVEIVQNLCDAPLLVHVYSDRDTSGNRLKTEKAEVEYWMMMRTAWENGTEKKPDGVIFVEQLRKDVVDVGVDEEISPFGEGSEVTRVWGVVVQSRGENCGPACYLLKTSRAGAGSGSGLCCTHFCLVKVKSFIETAEAQFMNSWLLNGGK